MRIHSVIFKACGEFTLRPVFPLIMLILGGCLILGPDTAHAQAQERVPVGPPTMPGTDSGLRNQDPAVRHMVEKMARERNMIRQKKIESDTAHLLALAKELNDDVSHSSKNTLSLEVLKDADEIEKLAKTIKEKMRDGT